MVSLYPWSLNIQEVCLLFPFVSMATMPLGGHWRVWGSMAVGQDRPGSEGVTTEAQNLKGPWRPGRDGIGHWLRTWLLNTYFPRLQYLFHGRKQRGYALKSCRHPITHPTLAKLEAHPEPIFLYLVVHLPSRGGHESSRQSLKYKGTAWPKRRKV